MRELLRDYPAGVPTDTLLARIRGRRSFLVGAWDSLLLAAEPLEGLPPAPWRQDLAREGERVWRALQREYAWVFRWMTPGSTRPTRATWPGMDSGLLFPASHQPARRR